MSVNWKMCGEALRTMPRVNAEQWQALDILSRWLIASRASVLLMTFSSAAIGGLLSWRDDLFNGYLWLLTMLGLLMAHATNNLLNDYTDSVRGIDKDNYYRNRYGTQTLESGLLNKHQIMHYIIFTGGVALVLGFLLIIERGGITLSLMAAGAFFVLFYSYPLKYIGLGEPAVLLVWGPLMIGGCYYVVSGQWSWPVAGFSVLYALAPTTVLFGKHIDKSDADLKKGVRSLPVLLGEERARNWVIIMLVMQYLATVGVVLTGLFSPALLLVLINLPVLKRTIAAYRERRPDQRPDEFPEEIWPLWYVSYAFDHTRKFSGLLLLGLILDITIF